MSTVPLATFEELKAKALATEKGAFMSNQEQEREIGAGLPHTDAKLRLFGTTEAVQRPS